MTTNISDVAKAADVSPATVSRVLNRPEIVRADKRERVLTAIQELGFVPSATARDLRLGSSRTIALLVGDISQPFHGRLAKAVERAAENNGFTVMLGDLDHRTDRLLDFLRSLPKRGVAGALLATADDLDSPELRAAFAELRASGVPLVTTAQSVQSMDVPSVLADLRRIGYDAAEHILSQGRTPLAVVAGHRSLYLSRALLSGVSAAARESGLPDAKPKYVSAGFEAEPARRAVHRLLASGYQPSGLVCANTPLASGAIRALSDAGLSVPRDVAVISCEDVPTAEFVIPSISAVGTDLDDLGGRAVGMLLSLMQGDDPGPQEFVPHRLIARESTSGSAS